MAGDLSEIEGIKDQIIQADKKI